MFKNKKFVVLLLCLVILAQSTTAFAVSFSDVTKDNRSGWAYDYIMELAEKGIINGYEDGTFKPENNVSYLETLKLLYGVMNPSSTEIAESLSKYKSFISSLNTPEWAYETAAVALNRGVVTENEYRAAAQANLIQLGTTKPIARYDVAVFMARALELQPKANPNLTYTDKNQIDENAAKLIGALIDTGVLHKDGRDGQFLPKAPIKRSEMAKMVKYAYDWTVTHPLTGGVKEQTETGTVISYNPIGDKNYLVYKNNSGNTVSALLDLGTVIKDKDNKTVALKDVIKFEGADVIVVYKYINNERHATSVKFTSLANATDGEYTFLSFRTEGNKYLISVKDNAGNKIEKESRYSTAKNGNSNIFIQDIKPDAKIKLTFKGDVIEEIQLTEVQTGKYYVEAIDNNKIEVSLVKGGRIESYIIDKNVNIVRGSSSAKVSDIRVGDIVDLSIKWDYVDRIVIYPKSVETQGSYTFKRFGDYGNRIYVIENKTKEYKTLFYEDNVKLRGFNRLSDLRENDQIEVRIVGDRVVEIILSGYAGYNPNADTIKFTKYDNRLHIDERNYKEPYSIYGNSIKIIIDGYEREYRDLPSSGEAEAIYDDRGNIIELHYNTSYGYYGTDYRNYLKRANYTYTAKVTDIRGSSNNFWMDVDYGNGQTERLYDLSAFDVSNIKKGDFINIKYDRSGNWDEISKKY